MYIHVHLFWVLNQVDSLLICDCISLKDECQGNTLRTHIHIGGHFMGRLVVELVF